MRGKIRTAKKIQKAEKKRKADTRAHVKDRIWGIGIPRRLMLASSSAIPAWLAAVAATAAATVAAIATVMIISPAVLHAQAAVVRMPDGGLFDPDYYAASNPDVLAAIGTDPEKLYQHYEQFGAAEGRAPMAADMAAAAAEAIAQDPSAIADYVRPVRKPVMQTILPDGTASGIVYHEISDDDDSVTFTFAGDINMDPGFVAGQTIRRKGLAGCFDQAALSAMRDSDIFMLNNEFTYSTNSNKNSKRWTFQARPSDAAMLKDIGTDIVSLANNHTYDYMKAGFLSTMDTLDSIGMPFVGAGRNLQEASAPYYYVVRRNGDTGATNIGVTEPGTSDANNALAGGQTGTADGNPANAVASGESALDSARTDTMTIAIVAATEIERTPDPATKAATDTQPGVFHAYDPTRLYQVISDAKTKADFVIAFVHWGTEQRATPDARQLQLGQGMVDAGVDLIIGDHSHCQETIGWIGDVPVIYSLGNYVFANYTKDTCLVRVTLQPSTGTMTKLEYLPLRCRSDCSVYTPTGAERTAALAREQAISPNVTIAADGTIVPK